MTMESTLRLQMTAFETIFRDLDAKRRLTPDGEARWCDGDLADWLGYRNPAQVRKLIKRHWSGVRALGPIWGLRGGSPFWLNFPQLSLICMMSRTPRANDVQAMIARMVSEDPAKALFEKAVEHLGLSAPFSQHEKEPDGLNAQGNEPRPN